MINNETINAEAKAKIQEMLAGKPGKKLTVVYYYEDGNFFTPTYGELREFTIWLGEDGEIHWKDKLLDESFPDIIQKKYEGKYSFVSYNKMSYLMRNEIYSHALQFLTAVAA